MTVHNIQGSRQLFQACINLAEVLCRENPGLAPDIMAGSTISIVTASRKTIRLPLQIQASPQPGQIIIPPAGSIPPYPRNGRG